MPNDVLAIDPGTTQSQFILWNPLLGVVRHGFLKNEDLLEQLGILCNSEPSVVFEGIQSFGMPVGAETFETCIWIGRFWQKCVGNGINPTLAFRKDVKLHLCGTTKAKDGNIRQALIDRYGEPGKKAAPGRLYGISGHAWSALALAVTFADKAQGKAA